MSADPRLQRWLDHMEGDRSVDSLRPLLAEDATFHSPVVHTPQEGIELTTAYLSAADTVFGNGSFEYVRTIVDGDDAMLEFTAELDGIHINGIDIIHWNANGLIDDFKVMVRPLKAINMLWKMMAAQLEKQAG
ncbi:nuclear transport factor 2 family protein [Parasphingopyxis algicola]|uniref:nuclear transport factor 2 family protein n=1 Tax=Parasphingopyxis algicola TaxID=2026624 RepID=UPI0015A31AAF|nr:nuclear transport factor 2 family protein [Parasphingopyxis algicola]QLC25642.1 nuclear transport factor 2 family protein [Parasphingopyxis algicola]